MDPGEEIRFRVTNETFVDCSPNAPDPSKPEPDPADDPDKRIPFSLQASINEPGLGLLSWWKSDS